MVSACFCLPQPRILQLVKKRADCIGNQIKCSMFVLGYEYIPIAQTGGVDRYARAVEAARAAGDALDGAPNDRNLYRSGARVQPALPHVLLQ